MRPVLLVLLVRLALPARPGLPEKRFSQVLAFLVAGQVLTAISTSTRPQTQSTVPKLQERGVHLHHWWVRRALRVRLARLALLVHKVHKE